MATWALSLLAATSVHAAFPLPERSTAPIAIVFPAERAVLPFTEGESVGGSVLDPKGVFQINGQTITVHKDGAFLAWVGVAPGSFTLSASLTVGTTVARFERQLYVTPPLVALPEKPVAFDPAYVSPKVDEELRAGDWLLTRAKVSLGAKTEFRVGRHGSWQPMRDVHPGLGLVEGAYLVQADDQIGPVPVEFRARRDGGTAHLKSPGQVIFARGTPQIAVIRGQTPALVKTGPGEGNLFFALGGTRFVVVGRKGNDVKLSLSNGQVGWIDGKTLEYLPPGAQPPRAETSTVGIKSTEGSTSVRVGLGDRVPFIIDESDDLSTLTVRFHYTYMHTNWIVYNSTDDFVDEIRLKQETADVVAMTVRLKPGHKLWGFWPTWDGNALRVDLKKPPRMVKSNPLAGVRVFLDPGHMPSAPGAVGPLGTKEMDVNLAIALEAAKLLLKEGAVPLLSRESPTDEVSLVDRPKLAVERRADLFVSVHNNFLGGETHPFKGGPRGYSIFYYHPHSLALARSVYDSYQKRVPLAGEDLRFGDLLVCRLSAMPAILTESAYLLYPDQEAQLLDPGFRLKVAQSIVDGLRAFLKKR
jgi:N-acetylmuramoyl-L-alanine amidase